MRLGLLTLLTLLTVLPRLPKVFCHVPGLCCRPLVRSARPAGEDMLPGMGTSISLLQPLAISCTSLSGCWLLLITVGTLFPKQRCPNKSAMALLLAHEIATYLREGLNLCLHHLDSSCISTLSCILPLFFRQRCPPEVCHAGRAAAQIARRSPLCWQSSQLASSCTAKMHLLSLSFFH